MNEYLSAPGIRFNDYVFTEPERLTGWVPPKYAGVFAILVKDPNWAPKPFRPLCFGEFGNNAQQHVFVANRRFGTEPLFAAVLPIPFSTTAQRCAVRDQLVWAYNPALQPTSSNSFELQHFEEPPTARKRRPIGFLPNLEPAS